MQNESITLLFQGPWEESSAANIAATRRLFPGARVVVSAWDTDAHTIPAGTADECVFSSDPGPLPPYKFDAGAPANNVNRQIVSAKAGLARVRTAYVAKIRTDCLLNSRAVLDTYAAQGAPEKIVVSSFYTLHPEGIEAFQFHVSDWFQFGRTDQVRQYWAVSPMDVDDARWFEQNAHAPASHYFARRYRARFAPEQYVSVAYARRKGYAVPTSIDDCAPAIVAAYERFLANEFVVDSPEALGLVFVKYAHLQASNYQFFNCVGRADWQDLQARYAPSVTSPGALPRRERRTRQRARAVSFMRKIDAALPWIKKTGCMPLVGKCLAFYR